MLPSKSGEVDWKVHEHPWYREADGCVFGDVIGLPESRVQALPGIAYLVAAAIGGSQTRV